VSLPLTALLESHCCPAALWSEDRGQGLFNGAAVAQLGLLESGASAGRMWLECIDARDRGRFHAALQTLQSGAAKVACSYRFVSPRAMAMIELKETALRLAVDRSDRWAVFSRYEVCQTADRRRPIGYRTLVHQVANNLQSIRGEVDLLRLSGALPQQSFDGIVHAIENIRELAIEFDTGEAARVIGAADHGAPAAMADGRCAEEVRRGRS
jgi:hypothetical protein